MEIHLSFTSLYFIPFAILLLLFTLYVYRITVPPVSKTKKTVLVALRFLALFLIVALIFEPKLEIKRKVNLPIKVALCADNSQSVAKYSDVVFSSLKKERSEIKKLNSDVLLYSFGEKVKRIPTDSIGKLNFRERLTSFELCLDTLNNIADLDAVVILSDGNITTGSVPLNIAEKLPFPVFTIGIGDEQIPDDVSIFKILTNSVIYLNRKTEVEVTVKNKGFGGIEVPVTLYDGNEKIGTKTVTLSQGGINNLKFTFTPRTLGERRMRVEIPNIKRDVKPQNNFKYFYVKVLDSGIKIAVVSGAPSADFSFVKNSLVTNKDFKVTSIVELSKGKTLNGNRTKSILDSAKVLFLVGFPAVNSSSSLIALVKNEILNKNKPFFLLFSVGLDNTKLKSFAPVLNFSFRGEKYPEVKANLYLTKTDDPILRLTQANGEELWNNLPPVDFSGTNIQPKAGSEVIAKAVLNERKTDFPFIIKYAKASTRSLTLPVANIWRWKLQPSDDASLLFDDFINNAAKWLNAANENNRFDLRPVKKIFSSGEKVYFQAEVHDESFLPVNTSEVEVEIKADKEKLQTVLVNKGNGLYEGYFENLKPAEYYYAGKIYDKGRLSFEKKGKFTVNAVNPELLKTNINKEFLKLLANVSGGNYSGVENLKTLNDKIFAKLSKIKKKKIIKNDYRLWSYSLTLIVLILLFSVEWFLRKRTGLL